MANLCITHTAANGVESSIVLLQMESMAVNGHRVIFLAIRIKHIFCKCCSVCRYCGLLCLFFSSSSLLHPESQLGLWPAHHAAILASESTAFGNMVGRACNRPTCRSVRIRTRICWKVGVLSNAGKHTHCIFALCNECLVRVRTLHSFYLNFTVRLALARIPTSVLHSRLHLFI